MKKMIKSNKKEYSNKGVTLIALVITIIVLLILVSVSMSTLVGENGILSKAIKSKQETQKVTAIEKVQIAVIASYEANGKISISELNTNLKDVEGLTSGVPITGDLPAEIVVDGYNVTIKSDGIVNITGEETEDQPIPIKPTTVAGAKDKGTVLDEKRPTEIKDKYENKVVVPEGFKIAADSADDVTQGVVIEDVAHGDTAGSQFVWIPVGDIKCSDGTTKTIELDRYTFAGDGTATRQGTNVIEDYYQELETSNKGNITAKDIEAFKASVKNNGGYYIGRYEVGKSSAGLLVCKEGQDVYVNVSQEQAATLSRSMYDVKENEFTSDLINSYAWDTAIVFIQEFSQNQNYSNYSRIQYDLLKTGTVSDDDGVTRDVVCNIYDMSNNASEWTTETGNYVDQNTNRNYSCVFRGGYYNTSGTSSRREYSLEEISYYVVSFRPIVYIK